MLILMRCVEHLLLCFLFFVNTGRSLIVKVRQELPRVAVSDFLLEGFHGGRGRQAFSNVVQPQGLTVHAECFLPESVLLDVLKVEV